MFQEFISIVDAAATKN